jgi:hypothetical protein
MADGAYLERLSRELTDNGAHHLFTSIMTILEPGTEPTAKDLKRMDLIDKELRGFRGELEARIIPREYQS